MKLVPRNQKQTHAARLSDTINDIFLGAESGRQ
jgi:hypothetical protein